MGNRERENTKAHIHLPNPLIHSRIRRQRANLTPRQLGQAHLALLAGSLLAYKADLLLRGNRLGLNLPHQLNYRYMELLALVVFVFPLSVCPGITGERGGRC